MNKINNFNLIGDKTSFIFFFFFLILCLPLASASSFGYNRISSSETTSTISVINVNTTITNNSDFLDSLDSTDFSLAGTDTSATVNCSSGQVLLGNGTCWDTSVFFDNTDTGIGSYDNIAMINKTNAFGDFNQSFDTNTLFIDADNGRVGIGTTSPLSVLSVKGTAFSPAKDSYTGLHIDSSAAPTGIGNFGVGIEFTRLAESPNTKHAAIVPVQTGSDSDELGLAVFVSSSIDYAQPAREAIRIMPITGNVGIGTTEPSNKLDVRGVINASGEIYFNNGTAVSSLGLGNSSWNQSWATTLYAPISVIDTSATVNCSDGQVLLGNGTCWDTSVFFDNTDTGIGSYDNIALINQTNSFGNFNQSFNGSTLYIDTSGNVGIGTTEPSQILHIAHNDGSILLLEDVGAGGINKIYFENNNTGLGRNAGNDLILGAYDSIIFATESTSEDFMSHNERMVIGNNGNVGIGTTEPSNKLDVRGVINASGEIYFNNGTAVSSLGLGNSSWNQSWATTLFAPINYGDDWNKTYADTLYLTSESDPTWNANFSTFINNASYLRTDNSSYYLASNPSNYINTTGEPAWQGNYTIFTGLIDNASYLSTYNATYDAYATNVSTNWSQETYNLFNALWSQGNASWNQSWAITLFAPISVIDTSATVNCSSGQVLLGNGTCWDTSVFFDNTDTGIGSYDNIAMINKTNAFGDFNQSFDTNTLFIDADNGRVGIGTTSPLSVLSVKGTAFSPAKDSYTGLHIDSSAAPTGIGNFGVGIEFTRLAESPNTKHAAIVPVQTGSDSDELGLAVFVSSSIDYAQPAREAIRIMPITGNVGIGTTTPDYPLHVAGNTSEANGTISIYAEKNISATGFITRTSVFDKSKGNALDLIKDADYYKNNNKINHSKFYGYTYWDATDLSRPVETQKEVCNNETITENYTYVEEECNYEKRFLAKGYDYVCENITKTAVRNKQSCHNESKYDYIWDENNFYYEKIEYQEEVCEDVYIEVCNNETIIEYPYTKQEKGVSLNMEIDVLRQAVYELNEKVKALEK